MYEQVILHNAVSEIILCILICNSFLLVLIEQPYSNLATLETKSDVNIRWCKKRETTLIILHYVYLRPTRDGYNIMVVLLKRCMAIDRGFTELMLNEGEWWTLDNV